MKSLFCLIAIIIYVDFLFALKITNKFESLNELTNATSTNSTSLNTNKSEIINTLKKCSIKYCLRCDPVLLDTCVECNKDFELYDNMCLSN